MTFIIRRVARAMGIVALGIAMPAAQAPAQTRLVLDVNAAHDTISRNIYGQFAEHLGRLIYDGVWYRASPTAPWQMRQDVVDALRKIQVPNIRWPGGCFADTYHWRDGVGPRAQRPGIVNTNWGGVTEDNGVGTHEYLALVNAIGAEPFIVGNLGSGTVQEMHDWWEYVNHPGKSPMADLRRKNGQDAPFNVRFWGMGNEAWGCGGNMRAEYYADELKRYGSFLPAYGNTRPFRIAVGPTDGDTAWTAVIMREAGRMIEGLDMHHYTIADTWQHKGPATGFDEQHWFGAMRGALAIDGMITNHEKIMDRYDPRKRVALIVGEWGMWHDPDPGSNPGFLVQQNTVRDALVAAASLDIFNKHAARVRGANIAQMVNVLQAMLMTHGQSLILTPTYHVFEFYTVHHDAVLLPLRVNAESWYHFGNDSVPAVSASASRDKQGVVHVTMSNLHPTAEQRVTVDVAGATATSVTGRILTGATMDAHNTFENPNAVKPAPFTGASIAQGQLSVTLPPHSVVVLTLGGAAPEQQGRPAVSHAPFGTLRDGTPIEQFTLRNAHGVEVRAINYGAIITAVRTPDRNGRLDDIVLGYDALDGYVADASHFGSLVGRYANRIAHAQFTLDGKTYRLAANDGANSLHGGRLGFDKVAWTGESFTHGDTVGVTFHRTSPDGEEGYPGTLKVSVSYALAPNDALVVDYQATTDKATPINLSQHSYWNLHADGARRTIEDLVLTLPASRYTPVDSALIPTGVLASVAGTPFDFRTPTAIGARIGQSNTQLRFGRGYDHNWVLDRSGRSGLVPAARVVDPVTGRTLDIATTEPGVQFYTGNFLDGTVRGKGGQAYAHRSALALETQHYPDSPNHPAFPSTILRPGQTFRSRTVFTFGVTR